MKVVPIVGFLRRLGSLMIWILVAVGLTLRFTVRDSYVPWSMIYYMTPIAALPIWFLIAGVVGSPGRTWARPKEINAVTQSRWSPARLNLWMGLLCLVWAVVSQFGLRGHAASEGDTRFVFWNVARAAAGIDRVASELKSWDAPLIALVEADKNHRENHEEWRQALSGYSVITTHYGGLVAVRNGEILSQTLHMFPGGWCEQFDLRVDQKEFTLLLVDIGSDPRRSRKKPFESLTRLAQDLADRPLIIAGDFNTPDDSIWYARFRETFQEAFRNHGTGYAATWPVPAPVLMLDQVWVDAGVSVSNCRRGWSACSDHRPVVTEFSIRQ